MSRCRWSSMSWRCDLYVYDDVAGGISVHVAGRRRVGPIPVTPSFTLPPDEFAREHEIERAALDSAPLVDIGGPSDGADYRVDDEEDLAALLDRLKAEGYVFPDNLVEAA